MKKQAKKVIVAMGVSILLFSTVVPSMTEIGKANNLQVNQQQVEILNSIQPGDFDDTDLTFLRQKEVEILASQSLPLLAPRAFSLRMVGRNLEGLWHRSAGMRRALAAIGFGWSQIKAITRGIYVYSYRVIAAKIATIAAWNWTIGAIIGVSSGAAIYTMGNFRLFY